MHEREGKVLVANEPFETLGEKVGDLVALERRRLGGVDVRTRKGRKFREFLRRSRRRCAAGKQAQKRARRRSGPAKRQARCPVLRHVVISFRNVGPCWPSLVRFER